MSTTALSLAPSHQGEALIDSHTPLHAIVGFVAGLLGVEPHIAMMVFIGGRIVEMSLRSGTKHALFEREGGQALGNEMTDLLFEMAGLHYGEMLREKLTTHEASAGLGRVIVNPYTGASMVLP